MDIFEAAKQTFVADLPNGATIILARPGQTLNRDPKFLRENFGIRSDQVIPLSESRERPLTAAERAAEADLIAVVPASATAAKTAKA